MSGKKNIRIPLSNNDKLITVNLNNSFDLLEILSLKFTQSDIYQSGLCSDYGVVVGRVSANNGLGIPNAKVSIFIPLSENDEIDPVISSLYPYKSINDKDENGYRYNLLPKRKQHGGHNPTGTFFDQEDILTGEEYLEVFEKYYNYTSKTNESGDFMIWGVPVGTHTIHIDIDLSDIGCFSLRPYDFIRKGVGTDKFERTYSFKSSSDIDGLPQIVKFEKTIEVYPFIGNEELCEIGISRVDFDLTEADIKIEPVSLILVSTMTDDDSKSIKKSGAIIPKSGYKCNLQTIEGTIESVRFTGGKVYGSDGELYPELEYFNITETIDQNGVAMVVLPMNVDYVYTNEFGEQEITLDKNKGIPTKCISRFRFGLNSNSGKKSTAKYLVPNIREFNSNSNGKNEDNSRYSGEYDELMITSYMFSDVFEDYLKVSENYNISLSDSGDESFRQYKKNLILNFDEELNEIVPKDYFYKFTYGKVYTVSSFQGSHYKSSQKSRFFQSLKPKDNFLGIKEIKPNEEEDCSSSVNYFPVNYSFRNLNKISLIISDILLLLQYIFYISTLWIYEILGNFFLKISQQLGDIGSTSIGKITQLSDAADLFLQLSFKIQEFGQTVLPLTTYPNCEECTNDVDNIGYDEIIDTNGICKAGEIKTAVVTYVGNNDNNVNGVYLVFNTGLSWFRTSGLSYIDLFPNEPVRDDCAISGLDENDLPILDQYFLSSSDIYNRFIGTSFLQYKESWHDFQISFGNNNYGLLEKKFEILNVSDININYFSKITFESTGIDYEYVASYYYLDSVCVPESINIYVNTSEGLQTLVINQGENRSNTFFSSDENPVLYCVVPVKKTLAIHFTLDEWESLVDKAIVVDESNEVNSYIKLYDLENKYSEHSESTMGIIKIEEGCEKYDKFYDEKNNLFSYIWTSGEKYDEFGIDYPKSYSEDNIPDFNDPTHTYFNVNSKNKKWTINNSFNTTPLYNGTPYKQEIFYGGGFIVASVGGRINSNFPLPDYCKTTNDTRFAFHTYKRKTKSGLTEIRDGVFTIVPDIKYIGKNQTIIKEWYKRKRIGLFFCSGVVNYSFIDNWLNGILYFFKFDKKILWDDEEKYDLNQRSSKFARDLIFFNVLDNNFYYRSTPFNSTSRSFIGQLNESNDFEILHPTTFYDVGIRDEFYYEICSNPSLDPTCSVVRDISTSSYQDPSDIIEYGLSYIMDISNGSADVKDFFKNSDFKKRINTINGDFIQLFSINSESGIEAFDLDNSQYFMYNNDILDPEDYNNKLYFVNNLDENKYGPLPIDFKMDENGRFIRLCLNNRLGDYSQNVPFYLWDKKGLGFGGYNDNKNLQNWDRKNIVSMKLQRIFSISEKTDESTNYIMADKEEEFLLRPMTKSHNTLSLYGNTIDSIDRFDTISLDSPPSNEIGDKKASGRTESELWLKVISGTAKDPEEGIIYIVVNEKWEEQPIHYKKDNYETFIFQTVNNYSGYKQVLSTPFMFYFGLRPQNTSLDLLTKYYGPKGYFKNID